MIAPPVFSIVTGDTPLIISVPHAGTYLPPDIAAALAPAGLAMPDTDWHVDRLYDFAPALGASMLTASHSRIAVDLNRSPAGGTLYPGQVETGICPTESFAGAPYYQGATPDAAEIARRVALYWQPYHDALRRLIDRAKAAHGVAHVLDGHSICGRIPRLFPGALPDLNLGTFDGASADAGLAARVVEAMEDQGFSIVLNGRFKGGHITRAFGAPDDGVHVLQLEMAWRSYTDEDRPAIFDPDRAAWLILTLGRVVRALLRA
jgi:N-formylglutamate deformylase